MNRKTISEALGGIDEGYIIEALSGRADLPRKENETMNKKVHRFRPARVALIAAALALVLAVSVGAYAADIFGFRALMMDGKTSIDDPTENVLSLTQPQDVPEDTEGAISDRLAASEAAWTEWSEYKAANLTELTLPEAYAKTPDNTHITDFEVHEDGSCTVVYYDENNSVIDTLELSAEEYATILAYDSVITAGTIPGYDFNYNVQSEAEADKLEEIAAKYGLKLRGEVNVAWSSETTGHTGDNFYTNAELTELTAIEMGNAGNIFSETPVGFDKVYWFDEGTFCVSYYVNLPSSGEQVTCYGYNSMYATLSSGNEVINTVSEEEFTSRQYTAADGTVLTILENGREAYIYAFLENSFFAEHVGTAESMTQEDVNYVADYLIYSLIGK